MAIYISSLFRGLEFLSILLWAGVIPWMPKHFPAVHSMYWGTRRRLQGTKGRRMDQNVPNKIMHLAVLA
jgi:hypothetical protein